MTQTNAPQSGAALTAESVKLLRAGDLLFVRSYNDEMKVCRLLEDPSADAGALRVDEDGQTAPNVWNIHRFTFIGRPDAEGWIEWSGGENPVPGQKVEVKIRDAASVGLDVLEVFAEPTLSDRERWTHENTPWDITAFRLARPPVATPEPVAVDGPYPEITLDNKARSLFAADYPGRDYDQLEPRVQIGWLRSAHTEILAALTGAGVGSAGDGGLVDRAERQVRLGKATGADGGGTSQSNIYVIAEQLLFALAEARQRLDGTGAGS